MDIMAMMEEALGMTAASGWDGRYKFTLGIYGGTLGCVGGGTRKDTFERWLDFDVLTAHGTYIGRIRTVPYAVLIGDHEAIYYIWTKPIDNGEELGKFCTEHGCGDITEYFRAELTKATFAEDTMGHLLMWKLANRGDSLKNYKDYEEGMGDE